MSCCKPYLLRRDCLRIWRSSIMRRTQHYTLRLVIPHSIWCLDGNLAADWLVSKTGRDTRSKQPDHRHQWGKRTTHQWAKNHRETGKEIWGSQKEARQAEQNKTITQWGYISVNIECCPEIKPYGEKKDRGPSKHPSVHKVAEQLDKWAYLSESADKHGSTKVKNWHLSCQEPKKRARRLWTTTCKWQWQIWAHHCVYKTTCCWSGTWDWSWRYKKWQTLWWDNSQWIRNWLWTVCETCYAFN